ncbi:UDP-GalNAc:beta-1,3-N-acetylgalactosaminyltransferase 1-like [Watersipora subatra]|uniref:UDP-GalNAc:beta-1, 3-N-acetylgalactosaminyltransferase 1-like n=1 Tax=Watersipora subatra TaxID=2589382 RepID=UPI00355C0064
MFGINKDATVPVKTVFFLMLIFGSFQLLFLFEVFYSRPFIHSISASECKCIEQLHISSGINATQQKDLVVQDDAVKAREKHIAEKVDEGEKLWRKIEEAEEAEEIKLDKELQAKSVKTSDDGEPDENIHGEKEDLSPDGDSHQDVVEPKPEIPYHTELELNPDVDDRPVRCKSNHSHIMLLYVYSAPGNFKERKRVRRTWASVKDIGMGKELRVIFFIGKTYGKTNTQLPKLIEESKKHKDIVQDLSYVDSYRNLTIKGMSALKWVNKYCPSPYRVVKVDDDTLVNPFAMTKFLSGQTKTNMKKIICRMTSYSKPYRNPASKYYVSKTEYSNDTYPSYCQGYGYIIPPEMVPKLIKHVKDVHTIAMEDVYFTGLVRSAANEKVHQLTALFSTIYSNLDKFLERIVARPELMFIGHVHTDRFAELYWKLISERYDPNKVEESE